MLQFVFDLIPQRGFFQGPLHALIHIALVELLKQLDAKSNVVIDRHGKRRGLLEHHAYLGANQRDIFSAGQQVAPIEQNFALSALLRVEFKHAVKSAQQRRFTAARRANKGGYFVLRNIQIDILQSVKLAVIKIQIAHGQLDLFGAGLKLCLHHKNTRPYFCLVSTRAKILSASTAKVIKKTAAQANCCQFS